MTTRVDVIFDVAPDTPYYSPTVDAVHHATHSLGVDAQIKVVRTATISDSYFDDLPDAVVIGPGSPYDDPGRAEQVVATARERGIPLVGT